MPPLFREFFLGDFAVAVLLVVGVLVFVLGTLAYCANRYRWKWCAESPLLPDDSSGEDGRLLLWNWDDRGGKGAHLDLQLYFHGHPRFRYQQRQQQKQPRNATEDDRQLLEKHACQLVALTRGLPRECQAFLYTFDRSDRQGAAAQHQKHLLSIFPAAYRHVEVARCLERLLTCPGREWTQFAVYAAHPHVLPIVECRIDAARQRIITVYAGHADLRHTLAAKIQEAPPRWFRLTTRQSLPRAGLGQARVARYAGQILEALVFFRERRIPYFHLCAWNVVVDPSTHTCKLKGYEDSLFGLCFPQQSALVQCMRRIQLPLLPGEAGLDWNWAVAEKIMVIQFGQLLWHMVTGQVPFPRELDRQLIWPCSVNAQQRDALAQCPQIRDTLELIFGRLPVVNAMDGMLGSSTSRVQCNHVHRLPTLRQLSQLAIFAKSNNNPSNMNQSNNVVRNMDEKDNVRQRNFVNLDSTPMERQLLDAALHACLPTWTKGPSG